MAKQDLARTLNIRIEKGASGMYFATSEDEPTFFLAQPSLKALMAALPIAMEDTIREHHHKDVAAGPAKKLDSTAASLRVFPRERLAEFA